MIHVSAGLVMSRDRNSLALVLFLLESTFHNRAGRGASGDGYRAL